ncbi:MAG: energy-coupling factor transporter transmembrane protein EcfT [Actinomycetes bacterium]|nr:energy-coupling factor transporter transmembrane protein EcfT [Actinomycetes bacterium]
MKLSFDIRARLLSSLVLIIGIVCCPRPNLRAGIFALLGLLIIARLLGVGAATLAKRVGAVAVFALPIAAAAPLAHLSSLAAAADPGLPARIAACYRVYWPLAAVIAAKSLLSALTLAIAVANTPAPELLHGLEHLKLPRVFIMLAAFMTRFTGLFAAQLARMRQALASRAPNLGPWRRTVVYGRLGGNLFVRAYERGERVHAAMLSRGYTGSLPWPNHPRWQIKDTAALAFATLMAAAIALM